MRKALILLAIALVGVVPLRAEFRRVGAASFGNTNALVTNNELLVASSGNALEIYRFLPGGELLLVARVDNAGEGEIEAMALSGDTLFVGTDKGSLSSYDLTDPGWPRRLAYVDLGYEVLDIEVKDDVLFVANGYAGLKVLNRYDLSEMGAAGSGYAVGVELWGDSVLLTSTTVPLEVIDITDPSSPTVVATPTLSGCSGGLYIQRLGSDYLILRCGDTLKLYESYSPIHFLYRSAITVLNASTYRPYLRGDTLVVPDLGEVKLFSLSDPYSPTLITSFSIGAWAFPSSAALKDGLLYTFTMYPWRKLYTYSLTVGDTLQKVQLPGTATDMLKVGEFLFVYNQGLSVLSIFPPSNMQLLSFVPVDMGLGTSVAYLDTVGNYLYVGGTGTLHVFDISDPFYPEPHVTYPLPYTVRCLDMIDTTHALLCTSSQLHLLEISTLTASSLSLSLKDVKRYADNYAVGVGDGELVIIGLSPFSIVGGLTLSSSGGAAGVFVSGDTAFVVQAAGDSVGLWIVDMGDPTFPTLVSSMNVAELGPFSSVASIFPVGVRKVGNYVFGSLANVGVFVADVSDPTSPILVDVLHAEGYGVGVLVDGGYIYYLDNFTGLVAYRYPLPTSVVERKEVREVPFTLRGRSVRSDRHLKIFTSSGRLLYEGEGYTFKRPGVFFVVVEGKPYRVVIR